MFCPLKLLYQAGGDPVSLTFIRAKSPGNIARKTIGRTDAETDHFIITCYIFRWR